MTSSLPSPPCTTVPTVWAAVSPVTGFILNIKDLYAFHVFYDSTLAGNRPSAIWNNFDMVNLSMIPTRKIPEITNEPLIWRYFIFPLSARLNECELDEEEFVAKCVIHINTGSTGLCLFQRKNMGVFKAVGFPEDVGRFYRLDEYEAYSWTAHGRYPTNTPGWWGGAHPFPCLTFRSCTTGRFPPTTRTAVFVEMYGYKCTLLTDTEVMAISSTI